MGDVANFTDPQARDLPARIGYALAVRELITLPSLAGSTLVAGAGGLDRIVSRVNVIEVPDILPWVKSNELLLTTGFPIRFADSGQPFHPRALVDLIEGLARCGAAALGVKAGRYLDELPRAMIDAAERLDFPLFLIPRDVGFDEVMSEVFMAPHRPSGVGAGRRRPHAPGVDHDRP